jgi:hypothetical protein
VERMANLANRQELKELNTGTGREISDYPLKD